MTAGPSGPPPDVLVIGGGQAGLAMGYHIQHTRGVTPSPGLYLLGHTWQHTRGSALLGWAGNDAAFLARRITSLRK
jgi:hypothetical protein